MEGSEGAAAEDVGMPLSTHYHHTLHPFTYSIRYACHFILTNTLSSPPHSLLPPPTPFCHLPISSAAPCKTLHSYALQQGTEAYEGGGVMHGKEGWMGGGGLYLLSTCKCTYLPVCIAPKAACKLDSHFLYCIETR